MRKNKRFLLYGLIGMIILLVIQIYIVPVSFDVRISSGEFEKSIAEKYAYDFGVMFVHKHNNFNNARSYNYNNYTPQIDELIESMSWEGRTIYTSVVMELDGINYIVKYEGKRFWFKSYQWMITSIIKL